MVSIPSRQFMVYERQLKKSTVMQTMNERGLKHTSLPELDRSLLPDCVDRQASFARPSSVSSENRPTAMCSDANTKSTDDSSSVLRSNLSSEILERSASPVEFEARKEASEQCLLVESAPVITPALCLSTTATKLMNEKEVCVTSRELQDYGGELLGPDTSHVEIGDEEGPSLKSLVVMDLCLRARLHTNGVIWSSIEAQGGSPIPLSKAHRISIREELRRVAASSGKKRLLERDPADIACAIVDVQIEERMDLLLKPNALSCDVEPDNPVVRVFHEETSSEYCNPLGNISDNNALACVEREAAGNSIVSQTEDEGFDDLQATSTYKKFRTQVMVHNPKPEPLPLITTSKIDQSLTVWEDPLSSNGIAHISSKQRFSNMVSVKGAKVVGSSQNCLECKTEGNIEGSRTGKRKRCEEESLTNATAAAKVEGVCFECKGSLTAAEKVNCSRNDCDLVYHLSCAVRLPDVSWSIEGKLICPQHVCYACGKNRGSRLWRCQNCSLATHENCIPCPEVTTLFHNRPGWAICWRHATDVDYKRKCGRGWMVLTRTLGWGADTEWWVHLSHILQLKTPTWDCQDIFRHLPVPDVQQEFNLTSEFIKEVMENDKEPPPYFYVRRNVFLVKKKRDDADDGVGCPCKSTQDVCGDDCECRVQSMSCSKDCKCSHKCTNKPFRKDKRLKVFKVLVDHKICIQRRGQGFSRILEVLRDAVGGWAVLCYERRLVAGVRLREAIKKDEFIIEYTGEVIDDAMCEKRLWEMKGRRSISNFYMCEIAKDFIIDATRKGNASRYLNHSCQPNCRLEKWRVDGETRVGVFAGRNIAAGEELNYDYKYVEFGPNVTCRCGAPNCRGAIGERFNANRKSIVSLPKNWGSQHKRSSSAQRR